MDPKSVNKHEEISYINSYKEYKDSWVDSEYSHYKFSRKEWDCIYRAFMNADNKKIHIPELNNISSL